MLWICTECTAGRAVDHETCPQCGATGHVDQGSAEHDALLDAKAEGGAEATPTRNQLIRAWAAENGWTVAASGPIPLEVQTAYDDAHEGDPDGEEATP